MSNFKKLNLSDDIIKAVEALGFENPSPIQERAIPFLMETNKDLIGKAQTGTGKTAAFGIPLLEKIDPNDNSIQAIILTPTRELANQVDKEIQSLGRFKDINTICIYGGESYDKQIRGLKRDRPQIVVGTPGRVIDLINKNHLKLNNTQTCILDEADEMLNMGFFEDVQIILGSLQDNCRLVMFSATLPSQIKKLISNHFGEYELIEAKSTVSVSDRIEQQVFVVKEKYFGESISRLIEVETDIYAMIFCRTRAETHKISDLLKSRKLFVEILNGEMSQREREQAMANFKSKKSNIMVCTDVAARGIDVNDLTHVFNCGLPQGTESYVHRIGRTGRAGKTGKAYTFVTRGQLGGVRQIERITKNKLTISKLPSVEELKSSYIENELESIQGLITAVKEKSEEFKIDDSYGVFRKQVEDLDKEKLMKLMFSWKFNSSFRRYNDLTSLEDTSSPKRRSEGSRGSRGGSRGYGRGGSRGSDRGGSRRSDRGGSRSSDRGGSRGSDRGGSRNERSADGPSGQRRDRRPRR